MASVNIPQQGSASWRDPVPSVFDLPAIGNSPGDARVATTTGIVYVWDGALWNSPAGTGTVTSVGLTDSSGLFSISGSPIVSAGNLNIDSVQYASSSTDGVLSQADWSAFDAKQTALTPGSISTSTTGVSVTGGSNSTVGPNVAVNIQTASSTQPGLLSSADWTTFNNKQPAGSYALQSTTISTSSPLTGGGDLSANRTLSIPQSGASQDGYLSSADWNTFNNSATNFLPYFGAGSDGDVTISSGTTSISRDMYYHNLTLNGTGKLDCNGYRVFVSGILDISAASAGAIFRNSGTNGGNGSATGTAGAPGVTDGGITVGAGGTPGSAGAGSTANGASGTAGQAGNNGGGSGGTKAGGDGSSGTGGVTGAATGANSVLPILRFTDYLIRGVSLLRGGSGGRGGAGGGGDGVNSGGGGGGAGMGGGVSYISAHTIYRLNTTPASTIISTGRNGGNGGSPTLGNCGGGAGGAGAGGGWIYLVYYDLTGSSCVNCLDVSGGNGGDGGNGSGTGTGGGGGTSGSGGRITVLDLKNNTVSETTFNNYISGSTPSGSTGGAGGIAALSGVNL